MDDWVGRVLSKVRIEKLIGRGGMADVYVGRHTTLNRPMAVKILHPHMTVNEDLRRRFRDEAQAVAALRHPNIVQVSDFDVVDDRPYIVMELLEGMPLNEYLRGLHGMGHTLPLDTRKPPDVFIDGCAGLCPQPPDCPPRCKASQYCPSSRRYSNHASDATGSRR